MSKSHLKRNLRAVNWRFGHYTRNQRIYMRVFVRNAIFERTIETEKDRYND